MKLSIGQNRTFVACAALGLAAQRPEIDVAVNRMTSALDVDEELTEESEMPIERLGRDPRFSSGSFAPIARSSAVVRSSSFGLLP